MQVIDTKFEDVKIIVSDKRKDVRGTMEVTFDVSKLADLGMDFQCKEQRIYCAEQKGTFYGIHFQAGEHPQKHFWRWKIILPSFLQLMNIFLKKRQRQSDMMIRR